MSKWILTVRKQVLQNITLFHCDTRVCVCVFYIFYYV